MQYGRLSFFDPELALYLPTAFDKVPLYILVGLARGQVLRGEEPEDSTVELVQPSKITGRIPSEVLCQYSS